MSNIEIKYDTKECPLYIGNTCHELDKAYQQGRADVMKEMHKILNGCLGSNDIAIVKIRKWLYEEQKND